MLIIWPSWGDIVINWKVSQCILAYHPGSFGWHNPLLWTIYEFNNSPKYICPSPSLNLRTFLQKDVERNTTIFVSRYLFVYLFIYLFIYLNFILSWLFKIYIQLTLNQNVCIAIHYIYMYPNSCQLKRKRLNKDKTKLK